MLSQDNYIYSSLNDELVLDGDFTIELWLNYTYFTSSKSTLISYLDSGTTGWELNLVGTGEIELEYSGTQLNFVTTLTTDTWHHIALVRENNIINLYVDGSLDNSSGNTVSESLVATSSTTFYIGTNWDRTSYFEGNITNVRITKSSVYSGNFDPKRTPLSVNQSSYGNINSVNSDDVELLMNFKSESLFLIDDSKNFNTFTLSVPSITPLTYTPIPTNTLQQVYGGLIDNSYYTLDLPENYQLNLFGKKYETIYLDSNNYITFDQGSGAGNLVLPTQIPTEVGSSGLFLSSYGDVFTDNSAVIQRISTGFTEDGEAFLVRVQGGVKSQLIGECKCYNITNTATFGRAVYGRPCGSNPAAGAVSLGITLSAGQTIENVCALNIPASAPDNPFVSVVLYPLFVVEEVSDCVQSNGTWECEAPVSPSPTTTVTPTKTPTMTKTPTRTVTSSPDATPRCAKIVWIPNPGNQNGLVTTFPNGIENAPVTFTINASNVLLWICFDPTTDEINQFVDLTLQVTLCPEDGDCTPVLPSNTPTRTSTKTPTMTKTPTRTSQACLPPCFVLLVATNGDYWYFNLANNSFTFVGGYDFTFGTQDIGICSYCFTPSSTINQYTVTFEIPSLQQTPNIRARWDVFQNGDTL